MRISEADILAKQKELKAEYETMNHRDKSIHQ